jgi:hypothetical protein
MDSSQADGFKWFGEGFDGFPKKLPDDTVEYAIYVMDSKLETAKKVSRLREVLQEVNSSMKELLRDYIWQRESFSLDLKLDNGTHN